MPSSGLGLSWGGFLFCFVFSVFLFWFGFYFVLFFVLFYFLVWFGFFVRFFDVVGFCLLFGLRSNIATICTGFLPLQ